MHHTKHLSEPHFTNVCNYLKEVEGRPADGSFGKMKVGDLVIFYNEDTGTRRECTVQITDITRHDTFLKMLKKHTLKRVLPDLSTFEEGVDVYKHYYPHLFDENGDELLDHEILGIVMGPT
jgi:ASC-1-like (ASCH) protein